MYVQLCLNLEIKDYESDSFSYKCQKIILTNLFHN